VAEGHFDWNFYQQAIGLDLQSFMHGTGRALSKLVTGGSGHVAGCNNAMTYHTVAHERGIEEQRMCHWRMHQFQTCLSAHSGVQNPHQIWPHPYLPLVNLKQVISKDKYYSQHCVDFRLLMDQYCNDVEQWFFIRDEMRIWKLRKRANRKAYFIKKYKTVMDSIKSVIESTGISLTTVSQTYGPTFDYEKLLQKLDEFMQAPITAGKSLKNPALENIEQYKRSELKKKYELSKVEKGGDNPKK